MLAVALFILFWIFVAAIVIASAPWRRWSTRVTILSIQVLTSIALPPALSSSSTGWQVWAVVLGPGAAIALVRLFRALNGWYLEPARSTGSSPIAKQ
ncbi:MAG: hypothetical protein JWQ81_7965 [Amycolatopsis sp.]|jgi:hypothetical protein|nr:hypothetical protein [Amycolatopsis sp.]